MADLFKYQIYCETESQWVTQWAEDEITTCPNNNTHTVTSGSVSIIDQRLEEGPSDFGGRPIVRPDSRPAGTTPAFIGCGDGDGIFDGKDIFWDFSNNDDIVTTVSGYKKKVLDFAFNDNVWIKDGTRYFFDAIKGSYNNILVICTSGSYYYDRDSVPHLATEDVEISRYIYHCFLSGSCSCGDEFNNEGVGQSPLPPGYVLRVEVIVPDSDNCSYGWANLELYRERSCLLPGESV